jgi:hypothetical protein
MVMVRIHRFPLTKAGSSWKGYTGLSGLYIEQSLARCLQQQDAAASKSTTAGTALTLSKTAKAQENHTGAC